MAQQNHQPTRRSLLLKHVNVEGRRAVSHLFQSQLPYLQFSPKHTKICCSTEDLKGDQLVGRQILICWDDGAWYEALVVKYYTEEDKYKLVYRQDDTVEVGNLEEVQWHIIPKKPQLEKQIILDGAIIAFIYPRDQKEYQAMIYDYSENGDMIKVAYIEDHSTDVLTGKGWKIVSSSPCILKNPEELKQVKRIEGEQEEQIRKILDNPSIDVKGPFLVIKKDESGGEDSLNYITSTL